MLFQVTSLTLSSFHYKSMEMNEDEAQVACYTIVLRSSIIYNTYTQDYIFNSITNFVKKKLNSFLRFYQYDFAKT